MMVNATNLPLRIIQEIYFIVSVLNDMSISTAFFIYFIYLLPEDNLEKHT